MEVEKTSSNIIDAAAAGAGDGLKLALNIGAMLLAFIALIVAVATIGGFMFGYDSGVINGTQDGLEAALAQPLQRILEQVQLALENGKEKPDVIYLTGGSARSPLIKKALAEQLPGIPIAGGDDFGSVTAGLARWAEVVFR